MQMLTASSPDAKNSAGSEKRFRMGKPRGEKPQRRRVWVAERGELQPVRLRDRPGVAIVRDDAATE